MTSGSSALRGRYLVQNPLGRAWLAANDFVLAGVPRKRSPTREADRILIAVGGHLGDAVLATSVLAPLRAAYPRAELGVVTGSWNRAVFERHPDVRWLHEADHWKLDRSPESFVQRWWRARSSVRRAAAAIREVGYDLAIDLYPYYPNASRLLAMAAIPRRVGFDSGGGGPRYTTAVAWSPGQHVALDNLTLLHRASERSSSARPAYRLGTVGADAARSAADKLSRAGVAAKGFVVVHPGAGDPRKEWHSEQWEAVIEGLAASGLQTVLTGAGETQQQTTRALAESTGAVDLCGRLEWDEFRWLLAQSRLALSVDTVTGHLAAAAGTPCVVLMLGQDDAHRWRPLGERVTIVSDDLGSSCRPDYGCRDGSCTGPVAAATVLDAVRRHLASLD